MCARQHTSKHAVHVHEFHSTSTAASSCARFIACNFLLPLLLLMRQHSLFSPHPPVCVVFLRFLRLLPLLRLIKVSLCSLTPCACAAATAAAAAAESAHFRSAFRAETYRLSESARLVCQAFGERPILIEWTRDGQALTLLPER